MALVMRWSAPRASCSGRSSRPARCRGPYEPSGPGARRRFERRLVHGMAEIVKCRPVMPIDATACGQADILSRRRLRRRWPGVSAGLSLGKPAWRTLGRTRWHHRSAGSFAAQAGTARSRLPAAPVSRSRPPCLGPLRASHAIGYAEPGRGGRSYGISHLQEGRARPGHASSPGR